MLSSTHFRGRRREGQSAAKLSDASAHGAIAEPINPTGRNSVDPEKPDRPASAWADASQPKPGSNRQFESLTAGEPGALHP